MMRMNKVSAAVILSAVVHNSPAWAQNPTVPVMRQSNARRCGQPILPV